MTGPGFCLQSSPLAAGLETVSNTPQNQLTEARVGQGDWLAAQHHNLGEG